jgi:hypothetical protein
VAGEWSYYAGKLNGEGGIVGIVELPDFKVGSIDTAMSAPSTWRGTIDSEVKELRGLNGRPILEPWNAVIMAEASGQLRGLGIYRRPTFNGRNWDLDVIGLSGYPLDMPYDGEIEFVKADPLDMFRHAWNHLQTRPGGNLGVSIGTTKSPILVGTPTPADATGSFDEGPRKWNWWDTHNLGQEIDSLARETPFDWVEQVSWNVNTPTCHIALGYPTIGGRSTHRFVLGENLATEPTATGSDFVNETWVVGNGEGRARIRGRAGITDGRIRRVKVIEDQDERSLASANSRASRMLSMTRGQLVIDSIEVYDHPNAPLAAIELGSEYPLYAETDHALIDDVVRVVGKSESPDATDKATLTVIRPGVIE